MSFLFKQLLLRTPKNEDEQAFRILEPLLAVYKAELKDSVLSIEDEELDRCVIIWLDSIFESLDTISGDCYPPSADYYPNAAFKTDTETMKSMIRLFKKLNILRYRTVPKILQEDDFWLWVFYGLEFNCLKKLKESKAEVVKTLEAIKQQNQEAEEMVNYRKQLAQRNISQHIQKEDDSHISKSQTRDTLGSAKRAPPPARAANEEEDDDVIIE